jgi:hypothetical protein
MDKSFMYDATEYYDLLEEVGRPLSAINPGSNERALPCAMALGGIEILSNLEIPILGGDILTEQSGELMYAAQSWGSKYVSLDWYCKRQNGEDLLDYIRRSHSLAISSIRHANEIALDFKQKCFVVLVI